MRFTTFAVTSVALATSALAVPAPAPAANPDARPTPVAVPEYRVDWKSKQVKEWHGKSYGGWGKKKQTDNGSPAPPTYGGDDDTNSTSPEQPATPPPTYGGGDNSTTCPEQPTQWCLTDDQATLGADLFRQLIQGYTYELALEALTEGFDDWSSAVNIIRNRGNAGPFVVNDITFSSREEFTQGHGKQPSIPFDTLNVWHGCDTITVRWQTLRSGAGQPTESNNIPVVGVGLITTIPDSENSFGFRINQLFSEFNSAAWLVNNGVFTPSPVTTSNPAATATGTANKRHEEYGYWMV